MWNTEDDVSGWNLDKERPIKTECNHCKEDYKCSLSTLLHCDYKKYGKCTQPHINKLQ